jgi:ATP-dependent helicase HrpB
LSLDLPIHALREAFAEAFARGPVVLSSPTGSGKSTEVPRWCPGHVLVVEPRRIACRSLATRVAELSQSSLGGEVGYRVRDEQRTSRATRILFATPGVVLRDRSLIGPDTTVVLDEFHERSLELDLLLALLVRAGHGRLVVMSATLEGERVASHVSGVHLTAEGRAFPVSIRYLPGSDVLPDPDGLPARVRAALAQAAEEPGDVLVFLPGKAEIEACAQALRGGRDAILPLHGGLSLEEQRGAFATSSQRKIILATNVAETSLTIPGIGVVIDTGLVRQTRYHDGRAFLALAPVAEDSAAQRTGRAGRTAPGVCYRLWSSAARFSKVTAPAMQRESLVPLVLAAAAWGHAPESLPWLDPPKPYALEAARADLAAWGALDAGGTLSGGGQSLFALPLEPLHARLVVAARSEHCLEDMIDLVSVLSVGRPLFLKPPAGAFEPDDLRREGCDATALIRALFSSAPGELGLSQFVLKEARLVRTRLRRAEGLPDSPPVERTIQRDALVRTALRADARVAHVARPRGRDVYFSNGGTEIELANESAARSLRTVEALLVLDSRAFGSGRDGRVLATCAMPVSLAELARAGLGEEHVGAVRLEHRRMVASIERVYAKRVLAEREDTPTGELARSALVTLLARGSLFGEAVRSTRERLIRTALAAKLASRGFATGVPADTLVPSLDAWLSARVLSLGVESGDDLALLSASDFLAPDVPYEARALLDQAFPLSVSVGDASYRAEYDIEKGQVLLQMVKGSRRDAPPLAYLPKFPGLRICVQSPRGMTVLRERG